MLVGRFVRRYEKIWDIFPDVEEAPHRIMAPLQHDETRPVRRFRKDMTAPYHNELPLVENKPFDFDILVFSDENKNLHRS